MFGDTVPTEGFKAAGMTFEKANFEAISVRFHEHFTAMWASLYAGATDPDIVREWHDSYVEAYQEGRDGDLEPNAVFEKGHDVLQPVPTAPVRHYFLLNDPSRAYELRLLVRRLQRMDVAVYRLDAPLTVTDFHPYGDPGRTRTLPTGTYWIPLAQGQKHWIQAMLNEDTYIPLDVTYDVTAWSNPLLMNLAGGWTGATLSPNASLVAPAAAPSWPGPPPGLPSIGLFQIPGSTAGFQCRTGEVALRQGLASALHECDGCRHPIRAAWHRRPDRAQRVRGGGVPRNQQPVVRRVWSRGGCWPTRGVGRHRG